MAVKTWEELKIKYPEDREDMSRKREKAYVEDCFACYENEGFAKKFWTPYEETREKIGQKFEVVERCTTKEADLCTLPMWRIRFEDGTMTDACPEEIITSEIVKNGGTLGECAE